MKFWVWASENKSKVFIIYFYLTNMAERSICQANGLRIKMKCIVNFLNISQPFNVMLGYRTFQCLVCVQLIEFLMKVSWPHHKMMHCAEWKLSAIAFMTVASMLELVNHCIFAWILFSVYPKSTRYHILNSGWHFGDMPSTVPVYAYQSYSNPFQSICYVPFAFLTYSSIIVEGALSSYFFLLTTCCFDSNSFVWIFTLLFFVLCTIHEKFVIILETKYFGYKGIIDGGLSFSVKANYQKFSSFNE